MCLGWEIYGEAGGRVLWRLGSIIYPLENTGDCETPWYGVVVPRHPLSPLLLIGIPQVPQVKDLRERVRNVQDTQAMKSY